MGTERNILENLAAAVRQGYEEEALSLCEKAIGEGMDARKIVKEGLCRGMHEAGVLFERHEYFLPELLLASEAMHAGIEAIAPTLQQAGDMMEGLTVVLGVVEGDVHEIGKNLVAMMLEAEGHRVIDLGYDIAPQRFFDEVKASGARVLALSTMMTTTIPNMRKTIELAGTLNPRPLIIVGGAPLSSALASDMGADGFEDNAARVPGLLLRLSGSPG